MPDDFFMSDEIRSQVFDTINKIENSQATQHKVNELWSEIKKMFLNELNKIPSIPISNNKKQKKLFRKSQPFWNDQLEALWKTTCQIEKEYLNFKVVSHFDKFYKNLMSPIIR